MMRTEINWNTERWGLGIELVFAGAKCPNESTESCGSSAIVVHIGPAFFCIMW